MSAMTVTEVSLACAVRYALGRRSYAVAVVADDLARNASTLNPSLREVLRRDICEAISSGHGGDAMDVETWRAAIAALDAASTQDGAR